MYLVETYDVDYPRTEPRSSRGFLSHKVGVEFWVTEVLVFHTLHRGLGYALFVKVHQSLQEVIHLDPHLCAMVRTRHNGVTLQCTSCGTLYPTYYLMYHAPLYYVS